jgi:murein DD-endopeptidase MepM/ murein hydrolase activator NlpD
MEDFDDDTDVLQVGQTARCKFVQSSQQDSAPVQVAASGVPSGAQNQHWVRPAIETYNAPFSGSPGSSASHEGRDYVHHDPAVPVVTVRAAGSGTVVYVRVGCPQSSMFHHNNSARECGAGWGNHIVVQHSNGVYTRYAHLKPGGIHVDAGMTVRAGDVLGEMGNSGRSETRHLHFELGTRASGFDSCGMSTSFDRVYNSDRLTYGAAPGAEYGRIECPAGYELQTINAAGGKLCINAQTNDAWGPFTQKMVQKCESWGGSTACLTDRWNRDLAVSAYGSGACPEGAKLDVTTGYCVEGTDGFGPFPRKMIDLCIEEQGGVQSCNSARWGLGFLQWIYRLANP